MKREFQISRKTISAIVLLIIFLIGIISDPQKSMKSGIARYQSLTLLNPPNNLSTYFLYRMINRADNSSVPAMTDDI